MISMRKPFLLANKLHLPLYFFQVRVLLQLLAHFFFQLVEVFLVRLFDNFFLLGIVHPVALFGAVVLAIGRGVIFCGAALRARRDHLQGRRLLGGVGEAVGVDDGAPAHDAVGARQLAHGDHALRGGLEVIGDALALRVVGGAQNPHEQKEGHHRRHHVGQRNFPATAVRAAMAAFDFFDNDGR